MKVSALATTFASSSLAATDTGPSPGTDRDLDLAGAGAGIVGRLVAAEQGLQELCPDDGGGDEQRKCQQQRHEAAPAADLLGGPRHRGYVLGGAQELVPHGLLLVGLMVLVGLVDRCTVVDVVVVAILVVEVFVVEFLVEDSSVVDVLMVADREFRKMRRVLGLDAVDPGRSVAMGGTVHNVGVHNVSVHNVSRAVDGRRNRRSVGNLRGRKGLRRRNRLCGRNRVSSGNAGSRRSRCGGRPGTIRN